METVGLRLPVDIDGMGTRKYRGRGQVHEVCRIWTSGPVLCTMAEVSELLKINCSKDWWRKKPIFTINGSKFE